MIETDFAGFVTEEDGGAKFMLGEALGIENPWVLQTAEDIVLAFGHFADDAPIDGGLARDDIDTDAPGIVLH